MITSPVVVRHAVPDDLDALVELRRENGRVHAALEPATYRVPDVADVRAAFIHLLDSTSDELAVVLVATLGAEVVGMAEIVASPPAPPDQILIPIPTAQIHIVVTPSSRGAGVGTALRAAVERTAREWGIQQLVAPIHAANARAMTFYSHADFMRRGQISVKPL